MRNRYQKIIIIVGYADVSCQEKSTPRTQRLPDFSLLQERRWWWFTIDGWIWSACGTSTSHCPTAIRRAVTFSSLTSHRPWIHDPRTLTSVKCWLQRTDGAAMVMSHSSGDLEKPSMPNHPLLSNPHAIALGPLTTGVPYGPRWVPMGQAVYFFREKKRWAKLPGHMERDWKRSCLVAGNWFCIKFWWS